MLSGTNFTILGLPILSCIIFLPLAGVLAVLLIPKDNHRQLRRITLGIALLELVITLLLLNRFQPDSPGMQFIENREWITNLGISYLLGVDGISLLMVMLTNFLFPLALLSTWNAIRERVKEFMICMLLMQSAILGAFLALDIFLFYVFWEAMLVPMYFMIIIWGSGNRIYAGIKFFIYTITGSLFMLIGLLILYYNYIGYARMQTPPLPATFSLFLISQAPIPYHLQVIIFIALFLGFAVKVPLFPLHNWLPDAHTEAPTAGSVILAGILLKLGAYGFIRFVLTLVPEAVRQFGLPLGAICLLGIIYGGLVAMGQKDMKRLIAYSSISHLGFGILGILALNSEGLEGGVLQMINHGLNTGAMFLLVGLIYERRHTREIQSLTGLSKVLPVFTVIYTLFTLASMGFPGLNGFVGELFILVGVFKANAYLAPIAVLGVLIGAIYMLWLYQRVILGKPTEENQHLKDLSLREVMTLAPIMVLALWIGIYPAPFLRIIQPAARNILERAGYVKPGFGPQASGSRPKAKSSLVLAVPQASSLKPQA